MTRLFLWMACETAQPLPPPTFSHHASSARMVKINDIKGQLLRGENSQKGVLLLVDEHSDIAMGRAVRFHPDTVFSITPDIDIKAASQYLGGLPGITVTRVVCVRSDCSTFNLEEEQSKEPDRSTVDSPDPRTGR